MRLSQAVSLLSGHPAFTSLNRAATGVTVWSSVSIEARPVLCAAEWLRAPRPMIVVTSGHERALQWQARLGLCGIPTERLRLMPSAGGALYEDSPPEAAALSDRLGALASLLTGEPNVVITTAPAALERTLPPDVLRESYVSLEAGQELDLQALERTLSRLGLEAADPVRVPGQFCRRGGIFDIFPMGAERPVRLELFGDEIESIRWFDPMTQRSVKPAPGLRLGPSRETLLPEEAGPITEMIRRSLEIEAAGLHEDKAGAFREMIEGDCEALENRVFFDRLDLYRPLLCPDSECALDFLSADGLLVLEEPLDLEAKAGQTEADLAQALEARAGRGEILKSAAHDYMASTQHLPYGVPVLALTSTNVMPSHVRADDESEVGAETLAPYRGQAAQLVQTMANWKEEGVHVAVCTDQPSRATAMLQQADFYPIKPETLEEFAPGLHLLEGNLAGGFIWASQKVAFITDQELFGVGRLKLPQRKFNEGAPISSVLDLKPGDFVVHINFGIGIYRGLERRMVEGVEREFLHIEYKDPDKLFVPADQLDRVQKYLAPGDANPKINRLSGGEWQKAVGKAREEAREFAKGLIKLYAERSRVERASFPPDSPWQGEMEATFPWMETPSQLTAIEQVKQDMEGPHPMDRLVCGDVGFGKTEVAIRAAFKAAQAGRQVAILCPTTILSEQHYRSFSERLAPFPTKLALVNRFQTAKEKQAAYAGLADGSIDIVVGTHALLNQQIKFKELGLLIIDEEQKFGVKHKEALKALRLSVDVLTLSATPIPRTLNMALMNIREMSLINDPPPGRLPIRSTVRPFAKEVALEAILREIARGGQIFYVVPQVQGIQHTADILRKWAPQARVAVGHGQMNEKELEPVMMGFIAGEIDILVSTTIVESGLDIPNANTLIVEDAHMFGLSPLYQLRGRVGRSDRQAYAYFFYPSRQMLTEGAEQRLQALADFSVLGSGYSLAMRDLQIRGAGDMLGAKQSGQINNVGYDLYAQLIEAEVEFLKKHADGERRPELNDPLQGLDPLPAFDLPIRAFLPDSYIQEEGQRLYFYKLLMASRSLDALGEARSEITDRYGAMPPEAERAIRLMGLRIRASALPWKDLNGRDRRLSVRLKPNFDFNPRLLRLMQLRNREAAMSGSDRIMWPFAGDPLDACDSLLRAWIDAEEQMERDREAIGMGG